MPMLPWGCPGVQRAILVPMGGRVKVTILIHHFVHHFLNGNTSISNDFHSKFYHSLEILPKAAYFLFRFSMNLCDIVFQRSLPTFTAVFSAAREATPGPHHAAALGCDAFGCSAQGINHRTKWAMASSYCWRLPGPGSTSFFFLPGLIIINFNDTVNDI